MTHTDPTTSTQTPVAAGTCPVCGHVIAVEGTNTRTACPQCTTRVTLTWVVGKFNKAIPCNAACQYATGPWCSCSCGGANHRRGYINVEMVPKLIRQRDADRHAAKANRKQAKKDRDTVAAVARTAALLAAHPELAELEDAHYSEDLGFLCDMKWALRRGAMTPGQVEATLRALAWGRAAAEQEAKQAADAAALTAAGVQVPAGRVQFEGTITAVTDGFDVMNRPVLKMRVETADGWAAWGTMPGEMAAANAQARTDSRTFRNSFRGRRVRVLATLRPSDGDPLFGFFSRPIASFVEAA